MRFTYTLVAACLVCAGAAGGARQATPPSQPPKQQPTQTPVFKSNIVIARLDIEAFDKNGKPVTDLKEGDFTVFENGARQDIRTFSREEITPEVPSPTAQPALVRGLPSDPLAARTRRIFLIVFGSGRGVDLGWGNVQGPAKAFDGAMNFIREHLLPQDLVSVMALNRATDLTTDHEQVAQVVERLKLRHQTLESEIGRYFERMFIHVPITEDIPSSIQADIDAAFQPPGSPDQHMRSALGILMGTDVFRKLDDASWQRPWNKMVSDSDLLKIYAGIEYLRNLDGEKHLICLRGGDFSLGRLPAWIMGSPQNDAVLAARANDARVVLDIISTTGLQGLSGGGRGPLSPPPLSSLDPVGSSEDTARLTGGQFTGVSYADAALGRIDEATRFGYILGYTPSNPALNDKYRNVTVKVNRPGVMALFRHGYTAQETAKPLDLRQILTSARLTSAEATDVDTHDIKVQATATAVSGDGQIRVDLTIDASRLSLTQSGGRRVGTIDLDIFCGDAKQRTVGSLKQKMDMSLDEDHYQRALKDGIPYSVTVPITAAATHVKVFVYDYGADLLGTVSVTVK